MTPGQPLHIEVDPKYAFDPEITKQFTKEELHLLTDPDELDNHNLSSLIDTH